MKDMRRNVLFCLFTAVVFVFLLSGTITAWPAVAVAGDTSVSFEPVPGGAVTLNYALDTQKKLKVMVEKNGKALYYNLKGGSGTEVFPLQMGSGTYTFALLENLDGNRYKVVAKKTMDVNIENNLNVYLQSVQIVKWDYNDAAVKKAAELTKGLQSDGEKVAAIYNYVVKNYNYDYGKLGALPSDYVPDINRTEREKKGICYDFSSLFASMLRSVGIPTKLVKGYATGVEGYHAWNEVYIGGKWYIVDTSYDIQMREKGVSYQMYKKAENYNKVSEF
ncbi:MAG: transglutaminase domain-containing protein [Clostridia bacterium]|nr:transglutaminase domain-containing protein [Clostridia bacterium]